MDITITGNYSALTIRGEKFLDTYHFDGVVPAQYRWLTHLHYYHNTSPQVQDLDESLLAVLAQVNAKYGESVITFEERKQYCTTILDSYFEGLRTILHRDTLLEAKRSLAGKWMKKFSMNGTSHPRAIAPVHLHAGVNPKEGFLYIRNYNDSHYSLDIPVEKLNPQDIAAVMALCGVVSDRITRGENLGELGAVVSSLHTLCSQAHSYNLNGIWDEINEGIIPLFLERALPRIHELVEENPQMRSFYDSVLPSLKRSGGTQRAQRELNLIVDGFKHHCEQITLDDKN